MFPDSSSSWTNPSKIGDLVTVGGFRGKVVEINTRFTVVRSLDGIENIVPNEAFVTSAVLNHSYTDEANTQYVAVTIDFNADVDRALAVMLEEVSRDRPRIVKGRKPWAYVDSFGDSGINLKAAFGWPTRSMVPSGSKQPLRSILSVVSARKASAFRTTVLKL